MSTKSSDNYVMKDCSMNEGVTSIAKMLRQGEVVSVSPRGSSMWPLLCDGKTCAVIIEPVNRPLTVGEMPLYLRHDGAYVIHRVVGLNGDFYSIRGDNCIALEHIHKDMVLGVVVEIHRKGRIIHITDWQYRLYVRLLMATAQPRILYLRSRAMAGNFYRKIFKNHS